MKTASFFILSVVFSLSLQSQNYAEIHLKVHEISTNLIAEQKQYADANKQFKNLLTQYDYRFIEGLKSAFENCLCNLKSTWEKDSANIDFYLKKIVTIGYSKKAILEICKCSDNATIAVIEQKIDFYDSIANLSLNNDLINLIDSMGEADQRVRMPGIPNDELRRVDSLNLTILKNLMSQYGRLLGVRDLNLPTVNQYALLLHHLSPEMILKTWHEKILGSIHNGDLSPETLAHSIDYAIFKDMDIIDGKPAVRYSRYGMANFLGICHPVKNMEEANKLRKEIGLPPLEYHLKKHGIIYDVEAFKEKIQIIEE